jgi:arginase
MCPGHKKEGEIEVLRRIALLGAPSSIGLRPDDRTGQPQDVSRAPAVLRELGLTERLEATDFGDVMPPAYVDYARPPGGARNEAGVAAYTRSLGGRIVECLEDERFTLVLGGDCSIVLGCLYGAGSRAGPIGLAYVDAHADFATPRESMTGSVASMGLALAIGHGDTPLASIDGRAGLVNADNVALVGRRDEGQPYGHDALGTSGVLDLPYRAVTSRGSADTAAAVLERVAGSRTTGFWILVDADVLDPTVMPAVGSPEPDGPTFDDLKSLLEPLVHHPKAIGMAVTLYDPSLDPKRTCAMELSKFLETLLR